jgi:hypothetical protein
MNPTLIARFAAVTLVALATASPLGRTAQVVSVDPRGQRQLSVAVERY